MEHALDLLICGHADVIDVVAVPVINLNAIDGIILRILGEVDIAAVTVHALLHQAGADFNAKTNDYRDQDTHRLIRGRTILQIAKRNKAPAEIMELLQKFGAQ